MNHCTNEALSKSRVKSDLSKNKTKTIIAETPRIWHTYKILWNYSDFPVSLCLLLFSIPFSFHLPAVATSFIPADIPWTPDRYRTTSCGRHISLSCCHSAHPQSLLLSNQCPCSTAGKHKQGAPGKTFRNWSNQQMTIIEIIYSLTSARINIQIQEYSPSCVASYLLASVVVLLSVALRGTDPQSIQPYPPIWARICGAALPGHSSQPLSNRRAGEPVFSGRGGA